MPKTKIFLYFSLILDCDPNFKSSTSTDLEHLVNRLERLLDRLERTVLARELNFANETLNYNQHKDQKQQDIATVDDISNNKINLVKEEIKVLKENKNFSNNLEQRIIELEKNLNSTEEEFENNLPTVLEPLNLTNTNNNKIENNMSVNGYEDIILGYLNPFLELSKKIGGDVATQSELVKKAFDAQFEYIKLASTSAAPPANKQQELLKPTSDQITAIQALREKNRTSTFFNHLSAISESIPALGWVCVAPTPGPHVKEMNDAGQFYTNRVLKDWKEKNPMHVEWVKTWISTLTELQKYIKQYHTTGLVWSGKGQVPSAGGPPPPPPGGMPPPPPMIDLSDLAISGGADDTRNALFAQINRGEDITKSKLKLS